MKRLSAQDAGFLAAERRTMPMHVGGLQLFSYPEGADEGLLRQILTDMHNTKAFRYPYDRKLKYPPGGLGMPSWIKDPDFDVDYHMRHSALPKPGRYRELFVLISRLHGTLLDRNRPLWEAHVIEGLESGQFAIYGKMHHALIDGIAGMRLLQSSLSEDPDERGMPHPWQARPEKKQSRKKKGGGSLMTAAAAAAQQLQNQVGALPGATKALGKAFLTLRDEQSKLGLPFQAPHSAINGKITAARRFVAQSYSLQRIRTVCDAYDCTINDVVLAMSGGALRSYLLEFADLPKKPLIAMAPVSVRPASGADAGGNAVSAILANLGTHVADPEQRMRIVRASMAEGKTMLSQLSFDQIMLYTMMTSIPVMVPALLGFADKLPPGFNVVISNVPGPKKRLYWNGAPMDGMYAISIVMHGVALNITITSYVDSLDFGITACRDSVPHVQRLIDYLEDALTELEQAAGIGGKKKRKRKS